MGTEGRIVSIFWVRSPYSLVSKLLLFDFWEYTNNPVHFTNTWVTTTVVECQPVPSTTAIASRLLEIFRDSGDSRMGRTCRLVCRDWARQCPVEQDWRVEDGVVWHWIETVWQVLPTRLWAWTLGPFSDEWWVERRCHQQWFPKVIAFDQSIAFPTNKSAFQAPTSC